MVIETTLEAMPSHRSWPRFAPALMNRSSLTAVMVLVATFAVVVLAAVRTPEAWAGLGYDWRSLRTFEATIYLGGGLRTALMAVVFSAVYLLAAAAIGWIYRLLADAVRARPAMQLTLELSTYALFVVAALAPMSMLMELSAVRALDADTRATILLLTINGLFFFVGISYLDFILTESHKTYAISAEFKSQRRGTMIREASRQFLLSRWASVYYFVLTFTMVPEIIEPNTSLMFRDALGDNIVKSIFHTIFHELGTTSLLWSSLLWLQALAFVATALLIRLFIDAVVLAFDLTIGLEDAT